MKFIITLLFFLFLQNSYATTYYISPAGNDVTGTGAIGNPWKTLYKATSTVTTAGDVIHVTAGTYIETIRCNLAVGVSIEGEGADMSIIQSTLNAQFVAIIIATSPEGTDGNQHISNIKLDGNKRTTSWAIEIRGRSNFSIHDCTITDFEETGVYFSGRSDNNDEPPGIYATGNSFYNNTLTNCAKYEVYGRGCLAIGGQSGMLIYNNNISQTSRAKGTNGWPIKSCNNGFLNGCKIYNNKIIKQAYDGMTWDFAIELFNESGLEIYNNTIIGSVDMNHQTKGEYPYSVYIHDNIMGPTSLQSKVETGIIMEYETETAIIENNQMRNLTIPVFFTPRDGSIISDVMIRNNVCENIGVDNSTHRGYAINFSSDGTGNYIINNFFVIGNRFIARTKNGPYYGIEITGVGPFTNIKIQNNTISNFGVACIAANPASAIDGLLIENNTLSSNGNNNKPFFVRGVPGNYIFKNNSSTGSGAGFNFKQQLLRPLYYEAKSISLLECIALFALFIALLFSSKENIYVFPLGLIFSVIYTLLYLEKELPGNAAGTAICAALCVYGWIRWSKRDHRKHRVVRITSSSGKELLMQVIFFSLFFAACLFTMNYYKKIFSRDTVPFGDALAASAVFTAAWSMVNKKVESWYWWMVAAIASIILHFFLKHYMFYSFCYFILLAISAWGLYQWKRRRVSKRRSHQSQT